MTAVLATAPAGPDGRGVWLKDNIATRALPTTAGSRLLEGWVPSFDATVVERLVAAGYHVAGKAALDEFAMGTTGLACAFGPVENPVAPGCLVGGSSSGCAALVASGHRALALGTDTGGSLRLPAAFTGIVGMRPTWGRVSRSGLFAMASSLDTIGPMAPDVASAGALLRAIAGPDPADATCTGPPLGDVPEGRPWDDASPLRVGLLSIGAEEADPDGMAAVAAATRVLVRAGARVHSVTAPDRSHQLAAYGVLASVEVWSNLARFDGMLHGPRPTEPPSVGTPPPGSDAAEDWASARIRARTDLLGTEVHRRLLFGAWVASNPSVLAAARRHRGRIREFYRRAFQHYHVLIEPGAPSGPPPLSAVERPDRLATLDRFLVGASLADLPGIVIPAPAPRGGVPRSVHLTTAPGTDERLLAIAAFLEAGLR